MIVDKKTAHQSLLFDERCGMKEDTQSEVAAW